jgi:3-phosphoshikimate 1-carboxyvinyltransferase
LFKKSLQGDSAVVRLFSSLGVETIFEDNQVCLRNTKNRIAEFVQDMVGQPDLAQTFVVTCCMLGIPFNIRGLKTLRIKETDRIAALQGELLKLGYVIHAGSDDSLSWNGEKMSEIPDLDSVGIDTYDDHRMAMAFAPVALTRGTIVINNPEVVSKSYPNFWQDLKKCGFKLD